MVLGPGVSRVCGVGRYVLSCESGGERRWWDGAELAAVRFDGRLQVVGYLDRPSITPIPGYFGACHTGNNFERHNPRSVVAPRTSKILLIFLQISSIWLTQRSDSRQAIVLSACSHFTPVHRKDGEFGSTQPCPFTALS